MANLSISKGMKKKHTIIIALLGLGVLYYFYRYTPGEGGVFLTCPFKLFTGYDCPGCGTQRALHYLLHGQIDKVWQENALLLPGVLLTLVLIGLRWLAPNFYQKLMQRINFVHFIILVIFIIGYGVVRNF